MSVEANHQFYRTGYYKTLGDRICAIERARTALYTKVLRECFDIFPEPGRMLDIGCGYGSFLTMAKERGWETWGIEPSLEAAQASREFLGDRLLNDTAENAVYPDHYFDVITLWNVLDYCLDPVAVVTKLFRWLSPNGLLVIRVPNVYFHYRAYRCYELLKPILQRLGWTKNPAVYQKANFEARTLERLLSAAGFEKIRVVNGELTKGDAYGVFSLAVVMSAAKSMLTLASELIAFLSGGRLLVGSSLMVTARKLEPAASMCVRPTRARIVLKRALLHTFALVGYVLGLPFWLSKLNGRPRLLILLYHSVHPAKQNDMNVLPAEFERHLDFLKQKYDIISLERAVELLKEGKAIPKPTVVITFDDGYRDNYQYAFRLLKAKKLPAAFFLLADESPGQRRTKHLDQAGFGDETALLSWAEAGEMAGAGMLIGSHGNSHTRLGELEAGPVRDEMVSSKNLLESKLSSSVRYFSYPYGTREDFGDRERTLAQEAGYEAACSKIYGTNGPESDLFSLKRIGIESSDTLFTLRAKLNGALGIMALFDWPPVRRFVRWFNELFCPAPAPAPAPLLLVSMDFPPHRNGVSTISGELGIRIAGYGKPIVVIGPKDKGCREMDACYGYRMFRMPGYEFGYFRFLPVLFCMPWLMFRYGIRKIFAMNVAYGGLIAWALSFIRHLDYIVFAYGYEFEKVKQKPVARWIYQRIYRRARAVVCCSRQVGDRLISFGVEPSKIEVLYPAVDLNRYRPCDVPADYLEGKKLAGRRILLTVGRLIERKGHDHVLRSLSAVVEKFPDLLYCIVGEGAHEPKLREISRRLGLEKHVWFAGQVDEKELLLLYNVCELFIMPSREIPESGHIEGFGIVFLEANACAKPVIGGKSGGVAEAIRDGETGLLVDPQSPDEISKKIIFLLSKPEEANRMGLEGLRWARTNFSWERYAQEAYRILCGEELK
ncbi:MAG: glycosyltransferase [Candidatus Omnitrophota bacterium]